MKNSIRVSTFSKIWVYFVSIPTSYVHYVIFLTYCGSHYVTFNILWFCQYTYLRVTCATSLSPYCGFVSIPASYVHNVTFNILWYRDRKHNVSVNHYRMSVSDDHGREPCIFLPSSFISYRLIFSGAGTA